MSDNEVRMYVSAPPPCDDCRDVAGCKAHKIACADYARWVRGKKPTGRVSYRLPTSKLYQDVFRD